MQSRLLKQPQPERSNHHSYGKPMGNMKLSPHHKSSGQVISISKSMIGKNALITNGSSVVACREPMASASKYIIQSISEESKQSVANESASLAIDAISKSKKSLSLPYLRKDQCIYSAPFDGHGALHLVGSAYRMKKWRNPHLQQYITVSSNGILKGSVEQFVSSDQISFVMPTCTIDEEGSWITIDLGPHRRLLPNYYALRHGASERGKNALRNWKLQAKYSSDEAEEFVTLCEHVMDESLSGLGPSHSTIASWVVDLRYEIVYTSNNITSSTSANAGAGASVSTKINHPNQKNKSSGLPLVSRNTASATATASASASTSNQKKPNVGRAPVSHNRSNQSQIKVDTSSGRIKKTSSTIIASTENRKLGFTVRATRNTSLQGEGQDISTSTSTSTSTSISTSVQRVEGTETSLDGISNCPGILSMKGQLSSEETDEPEICNESKGSKHSMAENIPESSQNLNDTSTSSSQYGFRIFRILQTGPNSSGNHCLFCGGIELYGMLVTSNFQPSQILQSSYINPLHRSQLSRPASVDKRGFRHEATTDTTCLSSLSLSLSSEEHEGKELEENKDDGAILSEVQLPEEFARYITMLRRGLPLIAVVSKMTMDQRTMDQQSQVICRAIHDKLIAPDDPIASDNPFLSGHHHSTIEQRRFLSFHWTPLEAARLTNSLWVSIGNDSPSKSLSEREMDQLIRLFSRPINHKLIGASSVKRTASAQNDLRGHRLSSSNLGSIRPLVIDTARAMNISICLAAFRNHSVGMDLLCNALRSLNTDNLTVDMLHRLKEILPTPSETKALRNYVYSTSEPQIPRPILSQPLVFVHPAEIALWQLSLIDRPGDKLESLLFLLEFEQSITNVISDCNTLQRGAEALKSSLGLRKVLFTVLEIGNAMNGSRGSSTIQTDGTEKDRRHVTGFSIETVKKLDQTKSTTNSVMVLTDGAASDTTCTLTSQITLVDFLVQLFSSRQKDATIGPPGDTSTDAAYTALAIDEELLATTLQCQRQPLWVIVNNLNQLSRQCCSLELTLETFLGELTRKPLSILIPAESSDLSAECKPLFSIEATQRSKSSIQTSMSSYRSPPQKKGDQKSLSRASYSPPSGSDKKSHSKSHSNINRNSMTRHEQEYSPNLLRQSSSLIRSHSPSYSNDNIHSINASFVSKMTPLRVRTNDDISSTQRVNGECLLPLSKILKADSSSEYIERLITHVKLIRTAIHSADYILDSTIRQAQQLAAYFGECIDSSYEDDKNKDNVPTTLSSRLFYDSDGDSADNDEDRTVVNNATKAIDGKKMACYKKRSEHIHVGEDVKAISQCLEHVFGCLVDFLGKFSESKKRQLRNRHRLAVEVKQDSLSTTTSNDSTMDSSSSCIAE